MIKYILTEGGIKDQETGACIPIAEGNRHYQEYLEWLNEGNTPILEQPDSDHILVGDEWIFDETLKIQRESEEKIQKRIRELAINNLKISGELPQYFKDK